MQTASSRGWSGVPEPRLFQLMATGTIQYYFMVLVKNCLPRWKMALQCLDSSSKSPRQKARVAKG